MTRRHPRKTSTSPSFFEPWLRWSRQSPSSGVRGDGQTRVGREPGEGPSRRNPACPPTWPQARRRRQGADGLDHEGKKYEYKVSGPSSNQYNVNFGHACDGEDGVALVKKHFQGYEGAVCGHAVGGKVVAAVYCPCKTLVPVLAEHIASVKGKTWQRAFAPIDKFADVEGAVWLFDECETDEAG